MHAARGIHKLEVSALISEELQPQIQLKTAAVVLKPSEAKISPLSPTRDVIPEGRQIYQNLLTYTLLVAKPQEIAIYAPILNSLLYESEFESQLWMLFDCNKMMIACGDAHSHTFYTKLEKGEYTVKLQIRHEKRDALEKISEANMIALFKIANPLSLEFFDHYNQCVIGGRKFNTGVVKDVPSKVLYVGPLLQEKLSKASLPVNCAWLSGTLKFAKGDNGHRVDGQEFTYILSPDGPKKNGNGSSAAGSGSSNASNSTATKTVKAVVTPGGPVPVPSASGDAASSTANSSVSSPKKNKPSSDDYAEGLRDFQCSMITKCGKCNELCAIFKHLNFVKN